MSLVQAGFRAGANGEAPADLLARLGPTVFVDVGLRSRSAVGGAPDLSAKRIKALIDTGAGDNCIDDRLARRLQLPIHDYGEISGVGGRHEAARYMARVYVPGLNRLIFQPFTGVRLSEGEQWHELILGRTFLRDYLLSYDGTTGEVTISRP